MSLGGGGSCPCQSVIDEVYENGVVIVASAGNGYVDANNYPASCDNVLSVSSIGSNGHLNQLRRLIKHYHKRQDNY